MTMRLTVGKKSWEKKKVRRKSRGYVDALKDEKEGKGLRIGKDGEKRRRREAS